MDFRNFFRGFFGMRQPKWDNFDDDYGDGTEEYCEECTDSEDMFFRGGDSHFFNIVQPLDPFSIFQQMEESFSKFFSPHSGGMLEFPGEKPLNDHESHRDFFLKPSDRNFEIFSRDDHEGGSEFSRSESFLQPGNPRDLLLKPSYRDSQNSVDPALQQDSDLDGTILNDKRRHGLLKQIPQQPKIGTNWSIRKSVSIRTVHGSDGTVEEHRTTRDSSGNEVTTVRKSIGDQSYTVTLHKDNEGIKEKKEDLVNLDERDIPQFEEKWHNMKGNPLHTTKKDLSQEPDALIQGFPGDPHYKSIFERLFRF